MKRFHDTDIWERPWFRRLPPADKCAVMLIKDRCDNAGVWIPDFEAADFFVGDACNWADLPQRVNGNIQVLPSGKWWIPDFCLFQYGELREGGKNPAHNSHIALLKRHGLWPIPKLSETSKRTLEDLFEGAPMGLRDPQEKAKAKAKAPAKAEEKETVKAEETGTAVSPRFAPASLEASVLASFSKLTPTTSDPAGNLDAIPELVRLASSLGPPEEILPRMIDAYHGLVSGSLNGISARDREFWTKQPCTPKAMRQLWDRLVGQVRGKIQAGKAEEEAASNPFVTGDFSGFDDEKEAKDDDDF